MKETAFRSKSNARRTSRSLEHKQQIESASRKREAKAAAEKERKSKEKRFI
ncbi:hypothetical protein PO124_31180 [Bacillus licheniformis]|nr:hypothetical protein [Bacillus licheniformis]